ncbi:MAG: RNA polymerase sigma factor, partial [Actinomycetota bacterium]
MAVRPQTLSKTGYLHGSPASRGAEFASLYREYFPRLVRLLTRRTGDSAVAEDLAQEVLLRALQAPSNFDRTAPMWPWLKTVALRLAIDHFRRNSREIPSEQTCCPLLDETRSGTDSLLPEVVASLPPRERAAVSLYYLDGWKTSETASFLGMSRP